MTPNNTQQPPAANPLARAPGQPTGAQIMGGGNPYNNAVSQSQTAAGGSPGSSANPGGSGLNPPSSFVNQTATFNPSGGIDYSQYKGMTPAQVYSANPAGLPPGFDWNQFAQVNGGANPTTTTNTGQNIGFGFNDVKPQDYGLGAPSSPQVSQTPQTASQPLGAIVPPNMRTSVGGYTVSGNQPGTSTTVPDVSSGLPSLGQSGVQSAVNTSNVPGLVGGNALSQQMTQAQQAAYQQATQYLDPQFANQQNALQTQLANQGIPQNSEAWNKAMDDFQRQKAFAYQQAQSAAVQQGNAAQAQLFGQGLAANQNQFGQNLSAGQFTNAAQQQVAQQILQQMGYGTQLGVAGIGAQTAGNNLSEQIAQDNFNNSMAMRNQDINELLLQQQNPLQMYQALTQGNGVTTPSFTNAPGSNVGGTDIASIIAQALGQQNNVYNAQVGAQNSNTSAAASIIAALLSDRRLKRNVRVIGKHEIGVPLYAFDYVWGEPGIGVMADELEKVLPHAVFDVGGFKAVNYAEFSKVA